MKGILTILIVSLFFAMGMCQTSFPWPPTVSQTNTTANWTRVAPSNYLPPRYKQSVVYDIDNNRLVIFGGIANNGSRLNDVWSWSFPTRRFLAINPSGTPPSARGEHIAAMDVARTRMLVFGGRDENGKILGDLWELSLVSGRERWRQLEAPGGPSARYGASGGSYVGATNGTRFFISHGKGGMRTNQGDTWALNMATLEWRNLNLPDSTQGRFVIGKDQNAPFPRHNAQSAMLGPNSFALFGGCGSGGYGPCPSNDGWILIYNSTTDAFRWLKFSATCPDRAYNGQAAPVPGFQVGTLDRNARVVIYGGYGGQTGGEFDEKDVFNIYDSVSNNEGINRWTRTRITAVDRNRALGPNARIGGSFVFVHPPTNGQQTDFLVFFGGKDRGDVVRSDLWYLQGQSIIGRRFRCDRFQNYSMIHGILMFCAFGVFIPGMMLMARHGKQSFLPAIREKSPWLYAHGSVNVFALLFVIPAYVVGIVAVNSYHFTSVPHAYLGTIALVLVVFNPIWAIFKPSKDSNSRAGWAYVHMWTGRVAIILGFINMLLGILMIRASVAIFALYIVHVVLYIVAFIILEVYMNRKEGISCAEALNPKYGSTQYGY